MKKGNWPVVPIGVVVKVAALVLTKMRNSANGGFCAVRFERDIPGVAGLLAS